MRPAIGRLRHRLTLETASRTPDGGGGAVETWTAVAQVWGRIVPTGGTAGLHLANAGDTDRTASIEPLSGGATVTLAVPAEGGAHVRLAPGSYRITGANGLRGSVSLTGDGMTSSFALTPPGPLAAPITVYPN